MFSLFYFTDLINKYLNYYNKKENLKTNFINSDFKRLLLDVKLNLYYISSPVYSHTIEFLYEIKSEEKGITNGDIDNFLMKLDNKKIKFQKQILLKESDNTNHLTFDIKYLDENLNLSCRTTEEFHELASLNEKYFYKEVAYFDIELFYKDTKFMGDYFYNLFSLCLHHYIYPDKKLEISTLDFSNCHANKKWKYLKPMEKVWNKSDVIFPNVESLKIHIDLEIKFTNKSYSEEEKDVLILKGQDNKICLNHLIELVNTFLKSKTSKHGIPKMIYTNPNHISLDIEKMESKTLFIDIKY